MEIKFIAEVEAGIDAVTDKIEAEILGMIASPTIQDVIRIAYSNGWENGYEASHV